MLYDPKLLPSDVQSLLTDENNELLVSYVSLWEITDKAAKFRLPMAGASVDAILRDIHGFRATLLEIQLDDIMNSVKPRGTTTIRWIASSSHKLSGLMQRC